MKVVYGYGIVEKLAILYAIYLILYIREIINYKYLDDVKIFYAVILKVL